MRLGRLAIPITVVGVVLMLAGAGTAPAAARVREPGVVAPSPAPMNLPAGPMAMDQPETSAASGPSSESALRVSSDSATPPARTWFPLEGLYPPDSPIASSFVKNGPAVAVAVLETVNPSVPVEGPDLRIVTAGAARDAAGRNGAGPVFQQAGITSYDITLSPGANLISLPLVPDDIRIEEVLAGILDRVETVWQYDTSGAVPRWRSYAPGTPSDLRVMRDGPGYWVLLRDDGAGDAALTITGRNASGPARPVVRGWNLVGFTSTSPQAPGEYLGGLSGSAGTTMVGYAGVTAVVVVPSAAPPQLMPGRGYWLYLEAAGTIGGAPPVTMDLPAQGEAILTHDSGAELEIPPGTTAEAVTVSITEVEPPPSPVEVGRVFDFSVVDSGGGDEELQRPVTVRLPYELSPGKEASDVVVLHWNEGLGEWEAVDGGVADAASGTITVRTSDLSEVTTAELMTLPEFLAEAFANSVDQVVEGTLGEHYRRGPEGGLGFKHLAAFKVSGGTQHFNLGATLLLDIDDLARVTDEGKANYVTFWVNGTVGAGGFSAAGSLSYGISLFLHQREVNLDDPSFRATFTPLTIDTPVAEISALSFTRGKIHPVSLNNIKRCQTCAGVSWADLSFNAVRAELDIEPYLDILKGVLESYVDGPRVLVPGGQFATALVGNLVVREGLTLKPAVEFSTAHFTSYDSPSPDELEKFDLSYGNQFKGVWGGVDLNGDGRGDMVFPAGGNDQLFTQFFTDPRQEREYYIERVDLTPGWKIESEHFLPTARHQAPVIGPANSSARVKWKVSRDPLAPDEAYATFKLVQDNARYLGFIDRTVDEINIKLWHTRAVADLAVRASGSPAAVGPGETVSYALAVTNDGADRADDVTVTVEGLNRGGLVLAAARAGNRPLACDVHHSGDIATCGLGALDDGRTVAVALDFNPSFAFKTPESFAATVVFSALSPVYDPGMENNLAEVTTTFQPPAVPDCATGGAVRDAAANPGLAADCEILLAARDILGVGPTRLNWSVDTPINNWYDVTLGGTPQRVTGLVLSGYGLSGTIPPELGGLTGLEYLDLRRNGLSGEIPQELGVLTNLRLLDLGRNGLTGEIPAELGGLPNLQSLWLQGNQLTGCIPAGLRNVPDNDLDELGLDDCEARVPFARNPAEDFNGLSAAKNNHPEGIWSDGTTMWVADTADDKIYAYNLGTKARDAGKDFNTLAGAGNNNPEGIWSDGTTMWVVDYGDDKIYAYDMATKARDTGKDFSTLPDADGFPDHIWSDRTTMWLADPLGPAKLYAYNLGTKARDAGKDFNTLIDAGNSRPEGIWSDGTTMWVADYQDDKIYAYDMATKARDTGKDFNTLAGAGNNLPAGLWSDEATIWVADYVDGKIYAYNMPAASARNPSQDFVSVSAGWQNTCGVRGDGTVACWGRNINGETTPPSGEFDSVSAGGSAISRRYHTCGLKSDGSVACWGWNGEGQATPPAGEFTSINAGWLHNCGVKRDGSIACWGSNSAGQATPPAGEFTSVSAGWRHSCGLKLDGSVVCWGINWQGRATPPAEKFASISTFDAHNCGVKRDGSVACWGVDSDGQATPPAGQFASVSAGYGHSCGVRQDGSVACWGWNRDGQATPPAGEFASVSAGGHTCGVRRDGSSACWGSNEYGQATPPANAE